MESLTLKWSKKKKLTQWVSVSYEKLNIKVSKSCCLTKRFGLSPSSVGGMIRTTLYKKLVKVSPMLCALVAKRASTYFSKRPEESTQHPRPLSRPSENIIYCIFCRRCNCLYTGETGRRLREPFSEHLHSIQRRSRSSELNRSAAGNPVCFQYSSWAIQLRLLLSGWHHGL